MPWRDPVVGVPPAAGVRWRLPDGAPFRLSSTELRSHLEQVERDADRLREQYAGRLCDLAAVPSRIALALEHLSSVREALERAQQYVYLRMAEHGRDPEARACREVVRVASGRIRGRVAFFELEWSALPDPLVRSVLDAPEVAPYARYLTVLRSFEQYAVSEGEESILRRKSLTSRSYWRDLYDDLCRRIEVVADGEPGPASLNEAMLRLASPEPETRHAWWRAITRALEVEAPLRGAAIRALIADKATDDAIRGYPGWLTARSLSGDVGEPLIERTVAAALGALTIAHRYYGCLRVQLGVDRLHPWDLETRRDVATGIPWDTASRVVRDTFGRLDERLGDAAASVFDNGCIDAQSRPGQNALGFTHPGTPSTRPYVSVPYTGTDRDVCGLAHEVAHAVHALLSRGQSILCFRAPTMVAEAFASLAEIQALHVLADEMPGAVRRPDLLTICLSNCASNLFYPAVNHAFEETLQLAARRAAPPSVSGIADEWVRTRRLLYGDAVELQEEDRWWWSRLPHWAAPAGYWQSYCFGHLLALTIWGRKERSPAGLGDDLHAMLSAGGSASVGDLMAQLGLGLDDPALWYGAIELMRRWTDELAELEGGPS